MSHLRISVPSPFHRLIGFYAPMILARIISREIRRFAPDVVHAHAVRPAGVIAGLALKGSGVPWCLTEHSGPLDSFWISKHGWRQIALAYQSASRLYSVSTALKLDMLRYFGDAASAVEVLYNGIETDLFRPLGQAPGRGRLLFVGGLEPKKGLGILFEALAQVTPSISWSLSIVGTGVLEQKLKQQAHYLGIENRIQWLGSKARRDMPEIYSDHDMVVVPSIHETFSLVCAEALACGRPVIGTQCGGPQEIVPEFGGVLVPSKDVASLKSALELALTDRLYFDSSKSVEYIEKKFSMSSLLDRLERTYRQLAGERIQ